jgi:hypothetical protein
VKSNARGRTSHAAAQPWVEWTNLTLGIFLVVSPWLALGGSSAIAWNAVICGAIIAGAASMALAKPSPAGEKTNICVGLWLLIAPGALGFSVNAGATWTSVIVGLGVICFAGFQLSALKRLARAQGSFY